MSLGHLRTSTRLNSDDILYLYQSGVTRRHRCFFFPDYINNLLTILQCQLSNHLSENHLLHQSMAKDIILKKWQVQKIAALSVLETSLKFFQNTILCIRGGTIMEYLKIFNFLKVKFYSFFKVCGTRFWNVCFPKKYPKNRIWHMEYTCQRYHKQKIHN